MTPLIDRRRILGTLSAAGAVTLAGCGGGGGGGSGSSSTGSSPPTTPPSTTPPSTTPVFPLSVAAGARHPLDAAGKPFMMLGDAGWSVIVQVSKADAVTYLADRSSRGFNAILINLIEHKFATNAPANYYGDAPFTTPGDYSTPNEAYFAHAEYVLQQAANRGLAAILTPSYLGYLGGNEGWYTEMQANGPTKLRAYGQYLATRFKALNNIIWVNGGDSNPPNKAVVEAIANGIRDVTPSALQTAHCQPDTAALDYWTNEPWLNVDTIYTRSSIYSASEREYQRAAYLPTFFIEGLYENENYGAGLPTEQNLRKQAYHSLLAGCFGHVFGNNPLWHFDGPGLFPAPYTWQQALSARGSVSMTYVRKVLDLVGWGALVPDISNAFLTGGMGSGEDYALASVTSTGSGAVVYLPSVRSITVNLAQLAGPKVTLSWYDPSAGTSATIDPAPVANTGSRSLTPPGANNAGFNDWVLVAQSSS